MKKILITGAGSYVGQSVEKHLRQWPDRYQVETVDMMDDGWRDRTFAGFDAVFHVAAIVHQSKTKADPAQAELYDRVNHRLAVEVARKAEAEGVGQFLFMSSESVYGLTAQVGKTVIITGDTPLNPADNYGISKKKAEEALTSQLSGRMKLVILRPPMIYGKGCKGNYQTMAKLARKLPFFPWVENRRSMLYIENFAEFVRLMIDNQEEGIFCPQDAEYVNTSEMVRLIAHANGKKILMIKGFTWALRIVRHGTGLVDKAFGSLCYDKALSAYRQDYCLKDLHASIVKTEEN